MTQVSGRAGDTGERPRDTGDLVANMSRPQHVAVLTDHQHLWRRPHTQAQVDNSSERPPGASRGSTSED